MITYEDVEERIKNKTDICEHLKELYDITVNLNSDVVVELGVRGGESTHALLAACNKTGGHLFSIDISPCAEICQKFETELNWTFIQGDDIEISNHWGKPIDHLFIDTTHTYDQTLKELELWTKHIKSNGCITLHDTLLEEFGVLDAVNDFIKSNSRWTFFENRDYCNGLGILYSGDKF